MMSFWLNIYNSNVIEGNTLVFQETALVLDGITIAKKLLRDRLKVVGYRDAFLYVQNLVRNNIPFSESDAYYRDGCTITLIERLGKDIDEHISLFNLTVQWIYIERLERSLCSLKK